MHSSLTQSPPRASTLFLKMIQDETNVSLMGTKKPITIVANPKWELDASEWEQCISTLVHEMLHAFLHVYGCKCFKCIRKGRTVV